MMVKEGDDEDSGGVDDVCVCVCSETRGFSFSSLSSAPPVRAEGKSDFAP